MPNARKEAVVSDLREVIERSKGGIVTEYRGLSMSQLTDLRRRLAKAGAEYHVVKNTLYRVALGEALSPELNELLSGPTAIAFMHDDPVAPSKTILDYLRELKRPEIKVKGGFIGSSVYSADQVTSISKLPPKQQIVGQLIGTLNAPIAEMVGTLDNIIADFVRTVQAIADKQEAAA